MSRTIDRSRVGALCFDLDGTLLDTDDAVVAAVAARLRPLAWLIPQSVAARWARRMVLAAEAPGNALIGLPDLLGLDDLIGPLWSRAAKAADLAARYRLVPGAEAALRRLEVRYPLALVSVREAAILDPMLEAFALRPYFRCIASARTVRRSKPHPAPILWAAEQMGVPASACLVIGDTVVDIRAGRSAGAQTVGVLCGFGQRKELERAGADLILGSTADLPEMLLS